MLVFVCSPLRGERPYTTAKYNRNLRRAAEYSRRVAAEGHIPITPHLYFSNFMDDQKPEARRADWPASAMRCGCSMRTVPARA